MILSVENASFGYGQKELFHDLSFAIEHKEIIAILGPNGVGKTTLLKCVLGFLNLKQGKTSVAGKPFSAYKDKELWSLISYVPQARRGVFSYRVLDMVVMGLNCEQNFFQTPKKSHYDRAYNTMQTLGIANLVDRYCNELSGGELQMVMLARALVSRPSLLILDEPESNLDMKNQLRILHAIEHAAKEFETACLLNTHFPSHALNISDKTLLLGHDRKKMFGKTKDLITEDNVEEFFNVRSRIVSFEAEEKHYRTIFPYRIATENAV